MKQLFSAVFLITATVVTVAAETLRFPDTVTLDNGLIRVGISAAAGRIVDFGVANCAKPIAGSISAATGCGRNSTTTGAASGARTSPIPGSTAGSGFPGNRRNSP